MNRLASFYLLAAAFLVAICSFATPSYADSQGVSNCSGCNGYAFQANLTSLGSGNYALSYTITNVSGASANPDDWSLTLFSPGGDITNVSDFTMSDGNQSNYTVAPGKANNGGNCSDNQQYALCVALTGSNPSTLALGQSLTFTMDFTCAGCTEQSAWDFLSGGACTTGHGNCYAISQNGAPMSMPEPSVMSMLVPSLFVPLSFIAIQKKPWRKLLPGRNSAAL